MLLHHRRSFVSKFRVELAEDSEKNYYIWYVFRDSSFQNTCLILHNQTFSLANFSTLNMLDYQ